MTPNQLRSELKARGLNTNLAAGAALGVSGVAVGYWLKGERPIPAIVERALVGIPIVRKPSRTDAKPVTRRMK